MKWFNILKYKGQNGWIFLFYYSKAHPIKGSRSTHDRGLLNVMSDMNYLKFTLDLKITVLSKIQQIPFLFSFNVLTANLLSLVSISLMAKLIPAQWFLTELWFSRSAGSLHLEN